MDIDTASERHELEQKEQTTVAATSTVRSHHMQDPDRALDFLRRTGHDVTAVRVVELQDIRGKVDWHLLPLIFLCYTAQFVDKVSLNYAAVMGLTTDLKLKGNEFSNAATAFFIAYLITEIPIAYMLNKVPAAKLLGCSVMLWGVASACTAAATDYKTLLVARVFLGIFEAAIAPCLMLISSQWYTKPEQAPRFSIWYCGLGLGQIVGGAISYGFQHAPHTGLSGWRTMFITLGFITVMIGAATAVILPDTPMSAQFLSDIEKAAILHHVSENRTGVENRHFKAKQAIEVLIDPQIWLMTVMTILISISSGVVTTYSATLIRNIGFDSKQAALLNMPSGGVSILSTQFVGIGIRYLPQGHRWAWIVGCCVPGIIGGALMSFLPTGEHDANKAGLLAGIYLINFVVATLIVIYHWTAANIAGHTKRVISMALISASFSVGNIIGPQTFQEKDAPQYIPAKVTVLATQVAGAALAVVLYFYYRYANSRKEKRERDYIQQPDNRSSQEMSQWANLTDKEDVYFRYVY